MIRFYANALLNAKDGKQKLRILLSAAQARGISDDEYDFLCGLT